MLQSMGSQRVGHYLVTEWGFPAGTDAKECACNAGDLGSIPELGRSPGRGHGNPLLYTFPGKSPWTEKPGELQSMGLQELDMTERVSTAQHKCISRQNNVFDGH